MTEAMLLAARRMGSGLTFEGWTSHDGPPAIQGREDGHLATEPLLALADQAEASGATGIIIGCFDDTALAEVRARVSCPVLGLGQAAYAYCVMRGWRFSVVTTLPVSVPVLEENISGYGFTGLLGRVRSSAIPVLELENAPDASAERIHSEMAAAMTEDGIDAVVLGCAGMVRITAALRARQTFPVIDPVEAAVGCFFWLRSFGSLH